MSKVLATSRKTARMSWLLPKILSTSRGICSDVLFSLNSNCSPCGIPRPLTSLKMPVGMVFSKSMPIKSRIRMGRWEEAVPGYSRISRWGITRAIPCWWKIVRRIALKSASSTTIALGKILEGSIRYTVRACCRPRNTGWLCEPKRVLLTWACCGGIAVYS